MAQNRKAPLCMALNHGKQCHTEGGHILIAYMLISQRISEYTQSYNSVRDQWCSECALNNLCGVGRVCVRAKTTGI